MDTGKNSEATGGGEPAKTKTKTRLWVVTELYYPEDNQTGYYLTRIAEGLADDFDVRVICGQPNYAARGTRAAKKETHRGVEIFRVWGTTLDKDILLFRLLNMLTLGISMFLKTLTEIRRADDLLVVSAPPSLPFVTALAAKMRRAEYALIIQDKYPEILVAVGKSKPHSSFVKILNHLNGRLYNEAKKIIVVGRDMKELVAGQLPKKASETNKIEVIQNWAALEEIAPLPRGENPLLKELNLLEKFVFLYAGNMGHPQDLKSLVECAEKLKSDGRFHFLFIGSGVKRKWLETKVFEKQLVNVTVIAPRPRGEQKIFLNACDVGLVPLVNKMFGVAMPSRTYNFLAAGKPVLALTDADSEVVRVIEEDQVGWYLAPGNAEKLAETIYKIYDERAAIVEMGKRARRSALEKYSVEVAINKFRKALKNNHKASDNDSSL
jgi:glycosyltransferase involved in cell wall biosynthesis